MLQCLTDAAAQQEINQTRREILKWRIIVLSANLRAKLQAAKYTATNIKLGWTNTPVAPTTSG